MPDTTDAGVVAAAGLRMPPSAAGTTLTAAGKTPSTGAASKTPKPPSAASKHPKRRPSAAVSCQLRLRRA